MGISRLLQVIGKRNVHTFRYAEDVGFNQEAAVKKLSAAHV